MLMCWYSFIFLRIRRPPRSTRTDTLFPYTTLFRSLSIAGWAVQSLRTNDDQGQQPFALPAIDYRWQPSSPVAGGRLEVHANSLSLVRTDGQDTRRALASVQWDMRKYTPMGQVVTLTGFARGDVYQTEESALTANALYRGEEGGQTRGRAAGGGG